MANLKHTEQVNKNKIKDLGLNHPEVGAFCSDKTEEMYRNTSWISGHIRNYETNKKIWQEQEKLKKKVFDINGQFLFTHPSFL